ncbi:uncharacterized protein PGTG_16030 [Puccinia graminis f. sp. tritici CRL 75-36-700-3]|uniref:Core-binding (CB) domain-containing protein n=1 Tax=Puccinia graminis f. sp. tritici (strain CRL 75-36-700-3 / race SCCL) TaxID=418459 RepID=E3L1L8_PUCGT|nr:uncharacterized protein PGTG_16030 [Puccinia graminis f. sp. tritici CRL 75-36-700-3]EFP90443.1 hypothetical protein PGTG_16030 [Puccinia graminis f. sp. tritici CRL 75-36-700-3]
MDLSKIQHFTSTGTRQVNINWKLRHLLDAWSWSTVLSYNAGVKKFLKFQSETGNPVFNLPATSQDLYEFCLWAGRTSMRGADAITSVTLTKYLFAIQAWHNFHGFAYPIDLKAQINLILKACAKKDAEFKLRSEKTALHLCQLKKIVDRPRKAWDTLGDKHPRKCTCEKWHDFSVKNTATLGDLSLENNTMFL